MIAQEIDSPDVNIRSVALARPRPPLDISATGRELEQIAADLELPLLGDVADPRLETRCEIYLSVDEIGPYLQLTGRRAPGPVRCRFYEPGMAHRRRGGQNELLGRAIGVHRREYCRVVDTTAGFAGDAFVLADLGARVLMCEQHPLLAALLGLSVNHVRSAGSGWRQAVVNRLSVRAGDACSLPAVELGNDDVLYLDPMFPTARRSAAGKGMALLQRLLSGNPEDAAQILLRWALAQPVQRVVVKRPLKASRLCHLRPSHTLSGRSVRFDVYQLDGVPFNES